MTDPRRTGRWRPVVGFALLVAVVGVFERQPAVLLSTVVVVAFLSFAALTRAPDVDVAVERSLSDTDPDHGEEVAVTVTVRNEGEPAADLRVVDGVAPMLGVTDGTPRHAATLASGETTTFTYRVAARHGRHEFRPATVTAGDVAGSWRREVTVNDGTVLDCRSRIPGRTLGGFAASAGGATGGATGTEFHATREYQPGDPPNRVDWNRFARSGALTTIAYRGHGTPATVLCLDARPRAFRARASGEPHAVFYGAAALREVLAGVDGPGAVGALVVGPEPDVVPPATGPHHRTRVRERLFGRACDRSADDGRSRSTPAGNVRWTRSTTSHDLGVGECASLLPPPSSGTRVVLGSPLLDTFPRDLAAELSARGYEVAVVSPDVAPATVGGRVAGAARADVVRALRGAGVPVADWNPSAPLAGAIRRGWSQ